MGVSKPAHILTPVSTVRRVVNMQPRSPRSGAPLRAQIAGAQIDAAQAPS